MHNNITNLQNCNICSTKVSLILMTSGCSCSSIYSPFLTLLLWYPNLILQQHAVNSKIEVFHDPMSNASRMILFTCFMNECGMISSILPAIRCSLSPCCISSISKSVTSWRHACALGRGREWCLSKYCSSSWIFWAKYGPFPMC
jgi:hypothetical protein